MVVTSSKQAGPVWPPAPAAGRGGEHVGRSRDAASPPLMKCKLSPTRVFVTFVSFSMQGCRVTFGAIELVCCPISSVQSPRQLIQGRHRTKCTRLSSKSNPKPERH
jgi:hypothetical protein